MHPHTLFRRARLACVALLLALTGAGCGAQYWSEAGGRWEKKAESPSA